MKKEDYFKYRVQGGDIYVLPEEIFDELFNELVSLQQENQELKDQLEQSIAVSDTNSELAESYYNENQKLKGSLQTHEILLRANVEENQKLKEQLQQKENVMNKAKEYIKLKLNAKNKDGFPFLLFKRTHVEKILEVLDNKGEVTNAKD